MLSFWLLLASAAPAANRVFYAGGVGDEEIFDAARLSDGRWLLAGRARSLEWLPGGTPIAPAGNTGLIRSPNSTGVWIGFLLVVAPDLSTVERCWSLPLGAVESIRRIRTTEVPGATTGDIYVSGNLALTSWGDPQGGYFIGKLDNNFVNGVPGGFSWVLNLAAKGDLKESQPWDVSRVADDTLLVAVTGSPQSADWMAAEFYDGDGKPKNLPALRAKAPYRLVLKTNSTGDFRSWTQDEYSAMTSDTNGGLRRGTWPMDVFFDGPYGLPGNGAGRGYTGYRGATAAGSISSVVIDRRTQTFYLGANFRSNLPDGNPDFEPWVSAYRADGAALWWSRLYSEWKDKNNNGLIDLDVDSNNDGKLDRSSEGLTSSPDQYVDGLAIDYSSNRLVVNARCHGNNAVNFWNGTAAAIPGAVPGYSGVQRQFTGTSGNIHITWLGKFDLADGTLRAATYLAGFARSGSVSGTPFTEGLFAGWPNPNTGWPNLNTTRLKPNRVAVDDQGRVYVIGAAPRLATTSTAWQTLLAPPATAPWNEFARVYAPDLSSVVYSTVLTGAFTYANQVTTTEPQGAGGVALQGVAISSSGLLLVGGSRATNGVPTGNPIPIGQLPSWARSTRAATDAIIAHLDLP